MGKKPFETLEERYRDDPVLLEFYKKRLLIKGSAGVLDECEQEYLRRMKPPWYASQVEKARKIREKPNNGSLGGVQPRLVGF